MEISTTLLTNALDAVFNASGETYQYRLIVGYEIDEVTPIYAPAIAIDFSSASNGSVVTSQTKYFVITAGQSPSKLEIWSISGDQKLLEESFTPEIYSSNGTFTISSVTITLTD